MRIVAVLLAAAVAAVAFGGWPIVGISFAFAGLVAAWVANRYAERSDVDSRAFATYAESQGWTYQRTVPDRLFRRIAKAADIQCEPGSRVRHMFEFRAEQERFLIFEVEPRNDDRVNTYVACEFAERPAEQRIVLLIEGYAPMPRIHDLDLFERGRPDWWISGDFAVWVIPMSLAELDLERLMMEACALAEHLEQSGAAYAQ